MRHWKLVVQRTCGWPLEVQGQAGWGIEQSGLVQGAPAHGRWVGTRWCLRTLPTQAILRPYRIMRALDLHNLAISTAEAVWSYLSLIKINQIQTVMWLSSIFLLNSLAFLKKRAVGETWWWQQMWQRWSSFYLMNCSRSIITFALYKKYKTYSS